MIGLFMNKPTMPSKPLPNDRTFKSLFYNIFLYIQCIGNSLYKKHLKNTTKTESILFIVSIVIGLLYIKSDALYNFITHSSGTVLLKNPAYLNSKHNLGWYESLHTTEEDTHYNYNYSISAWIYINYHGPNINSSYSQYTSLLNYGNKPNIEYLGTSNTIRITMPDNVGVSQTIYKSSEIKMNKWNNFIINYSGGTLDIFINGELVVSKPGIVPYMELDEVSAGSSPGIDGGIKQVIYYDHSLTKSEIISNYLKNTAHK
jgi:hypothetical protein